jgi:GH15 family glucan-1,4-alpha-glucosidase
LSLASPVPVEIDGDTARATFSLRSGETAAFILKWDEETPRPIPDYDIPYKLGTTEAYWRLKTSDWRYRGRWSELVKRSVLALHQLIYAPSGAICAAVTTSPGLIGGPATGITVLLAATPLHPGRLPSPGHTDDTSSFLNWLSERASNVPENLRTLYGIGRETEIEERVLDHLEGYRGSRPVRIGNAASKQEQLDDDGELLLAFASYYRAGGYIDDSFWRLAETLVEGAVANWQQPDNGIWEVRGERRHSCTPN